MEQQVDHVAGLDVHRDTVVACPRLFRGDEPVDAGEVRHDHRGGGRPGRVAGRPRGDRVAMEATGVYWKPVYYALEGLFEELWLLTPSTSRTCRAARPTWPTPSGWPTWPPMA